MMEINCLENLLKNNINNTDIVKIYGYETKIMEFLTKFYILTLKNGIYINNISNPTEEEVKEFMNDVKQNITYSKGEITGFFQYLDKKEKLADRIIEFLQNSKFSSESIKKNAYIKIMCWFRFRFLNVIRHNNPKILFEGVPTKYENYLFELLKQLGADVVLVDFNNKPINTNEKNIIISERFGAPLVHFKEIAKSRLNEENKPSQAVETKQIPTHIEHHTQTQVLQIDERDFFISNTFANNNNVFEAVLDINRQKNNIYCYIKGTLEESQYKTQLFEFKNNITSSQIKHIIEEGSINNPSVSEVDKFRNINDLSNFNVTFLPKIELNRVAKNAILKVLSNESKIKQKNLLTCILCWLDRYKEILNGKNSIFVLFNGHKYSDLIFLRVLKLIGVDVFLINPNKNTVLELCDDEFLVIEYENSTEILNYPKTKQISSARTVASNAESELDEVLYNDSGFFRDRQFKTSNPITIKTTYDEISILWKIEAKYRPHFEVIDNVVKVPNIFAKVSGVTQTNPQKYIQSIKELQTKDTILHNKFGFSKLDLQSPFLHKISQFIKNEKLDIGKILKDDDYKYSHLSEDTSRYILQKIEEMLSLDIISEDKSKLDKITLAVLLDLDKEILQAIQKFDFTKEIPKFIVLHTDETMPTLEDVILLTFLNLVGFDIIIFTPTGYRNVEKYIKNSLVNEYKVGEFIFNIDGNLILKSDSIMNKLFGRSF